MTSSDEPPFLSIDTEVSAKYKGAFCEARIKKVQKSVKCKVTFKHGNGTFTINDDLIKGILRLNSHVEAKHPDKNQIMEAIINKIIDQSQYTVVFDDGDETTLRRTSLCLKSGKHFAESETLDQLPLTNPEHFGNPVSLGRKKKRKKVKIVRGKDKDDDEHDTKSRKDHQDHYSQDSKSNKSDENEDKARRPRGRVKKKEEETSGPPDEDTMTGQSLDDSDDDSRSSKGIDESQISVGDGLKVKYGRGRQLKVYEAKVIKMQIDPADNKTKYFVHYSGWNSRYDEWIKKSRIVNVIRDKSPKRRSGKVKNKGEPLPSDQGTGPAIEPVQETTSKSTPLPPATPNKRGRPPQLAKTASSLQLNSPVESKTTITPAATPQPTNSVRRGRPPVSSKKEKVSRKAVQEQDNELSQPNEPQVKDSSRSTRSTRLTEDKSVKNEVEAINETENGTDKIDNLSTQSSGRLVGSPDLMDEATLENKGPEEEEIKTLTQSQIETDEKKPNLTEIQRLLATDSEATKIIKEKEKIESKNLEQQGQGAQKDAFDFEDDELDKDDQLLKEQFKKKRKAKDDKKDLKKEKEEANLKQQKEIQPRKYKKAKKDTKETVSTESTADGFTTLEIEQPKKLKRSVSIEQQQQTVQPQTIQQQTLQQQQQQQQQQLQQQQQQQQQQQEPQKVEESNLVEEVEVVKKRKGRKKKEENIKAKKLKTTATKMPEIEQINEDDSNLELEKLFEKSISEHSDSISKSPNEMGIELMKTSQSQIPTQEILCEESSDHLNHANNNISESDFLLCEEAVPASPDGLKQETEQQLHSRANDTIEPQASPGNSLGHSSPGSAAEEVANLNQNEIKESRSSSNSEIENDPERSFAVERNEKMMERNNKDLKNDNEEAISRHECNKSPISPTKKRRRGRTRTTSQSGQHPHQSEQQQGPSSHQPPHKERVGCKTRGASIRGHKNDRNSPITSSDHSFGHLFIPTTSMINFVPASKYNFCIPIDESVDPDRRVIILQERINELRKTYLNIKSEVAMLDRKKKKAKKKEREKAKSNETQQQNDKDSNNNKNDEKSNPLSTSSSVSINSSATTNLISTTISNETKQL